MLAKLAEELPSGASYLYEPKWDGFRAIVFRGRNDVYIQSRDSRPLDRYFPELHDALLERLPKDCVVDGEIVIATAQGLDFDALQLRLHPAESRVVKLAKDTPSSSLLSTCLRSADVISWDYRNPNAAPFSRTCCVRSGRPYISHRSRATGRLARVADSFRRSRPRRCDRETGVGSVPARQARNDQGKARAHGRLCGRGIPLAQERGGRDRFAAAWPVRRRRSAPARRGYFLLHHGQAQAARNGARAPA